MCLPFSFVTHHPLLFNPHCHTRHVDLLVFFIFILFSPPNCVPSWLLCHFFTLRTESGWWCRGFGSDYRPHSSKPWEETCCTAGYRKTADRRLVSEIHTVNWCGAAKRGNQCNQWARECCKDLLKFCFLIFHLNWTVAWKRCFPLLICCRCWCYDPYQTALRLTDFGLRWSHFDRKRSYQEVGFLFFCFSVITEGRKTAPLWVIGDGRNPLEPAF